MPVAPPPPILPPNHRAPSPSSLRRGRLKTWSPPQVSETCPVPLGGDPKVGGGWRGVITAGGGSGSWITALLPLGPVLPQAPTPSCSVPWRWRGLGGGRCTCAACPMAVAPPAPRHAEPPATRPLTAAPCVSILAPRALGTAPPGPGDPPGTPCPQFPEAWALGGCRGVPMVGIGNPPLPPRCRGYPDPPDHGDPPGHRGPPTPQF